MAFMVYMANRQSTDLVSTDYYDQELKFQGKMDAIKNTQKLSAPIKSTVDGKKVSLIFPPEMIGKKIQGQVKLYRPSNASLDYKTELNIGVDGKQALSSDQFRKGLYKLQGSWSMDSLKFYFEDQLFLN